MSLPIASDRVAAIYRDAMRLAEAARGYFDRDGATARAALSPEARTMLAAESVRITARLLATVSWVLIQQEIAAGNRNALTGLLASAIEAPPLRTDLPPAALQIAAATRALYDQMRAFSEEH